MRELEQISGIGPAMAEMLAEMTPPVETLYELVDWDPDALAESLEGASVERVQGWQAQAIELIARREKMTSPGPPSPGPPSPSPSQRMGGGEMASPALSQKAGGDEAAHGPPLSEEGVVQVWVHAREGRFLPRKGLGGRGYGECYLVTADVAAQLLKADPALRLDRPEVENTDWQD